MNTPNWIDSAQDRDYWRVLVNTALNPWVSYAMELVYICTYIYIPYNVKKLQATEIGNKKYSILRDVMEHVYPTNIFKNDIIRDPICLSNKNCLYMHCN